MNGIIYQQLSFDIERYITENAITGRLPGIRKFCRELGCHHVTLTKALRVLEERGIVSIRERGGTYVIPKPTVHQYRTIGIVGGKSQQADIPEVLALLKEQNYHYIHISFDQELFRENPRVLLNFPVDGFVFHMSSLRQEQLTFLQREGIPFVTTDNWSSSYQVNVIGPNHAIGYRKILRELQKLGHRRIGFVEFLRVPEYMFYLNSIRRTFMDSLGDDFLPELFFTPCTNNEFRNRRQNSTAEIGNRFIREALHYFATQPELPDAIIAPDSFAIFLNRQLQEHGFRIPEDISITGIFRYHSHDGFDGMVSDNHLMLRLAVEYLLKCLTANVNPECRRLVPPHSVKGHTIGPAVPPKRELWNNFL